jgi:hypothetical protein
MNLIVEKTRKNDVSNTNGVICLSARNATVHRFAKRASAVADDIGLRAAVRGSHFWAIAVALFLVAGSVNGSIAHIVPLLANRGVSTQAATAALSSAGLALILGRILSGYCLDRLFAPFVSDFLPGAALRDSIARQRYQYRICFVRRNSARNRHRSGSRYHGLSGRSLFRSFKLWQDLRHAARHP